MKNILPIIVGATAFGLLTASSALPSALPALQQEVGCVASNPQTGSSGQLPQGAIVTHQVVSASGTCPPGQCTWDLSASIIVPAWAGMYVSMVGSSTFGGTLGPNGGGSLTIPQESVACGGTAQSFSITVTDSNGNVPYARTWNLTCSACPESE